VIGEPKHRRTAPFDSSTFLLISSPCSSWLYKLTSHSKQIGAVFAVGRFGVSKPVADLGRDLTRDRRRARLVKRLTWLFQSRGTAKGSSHSRGREALCRSCRVSGIPRPAM
jgi:hypothetical protein